MVNPIIRARGLTKRYGQKHALKDASFDVFPGRIVGLVGPNGSGKTTTINALVGLTDFQGELTVCGLDPRKSRAAVIKDVAFVADVSIMPTWLRVDQAIDFIEGVHPRFNRKRAMDALATTGITLRMTVGSMSKGTVAQLHLALIMAIDSNLLILDEPTLGLDVVYREQFYKRLLDHYADHNRTIILATHQIDEVENVLTDVIFIKDGAVALSCSMEEAELRFQEVTVKPDQLGLALLLNPIQRHERLGEAVLLFDGVSKNILAEFGPVSRPSLTTIFKAQMRGAVA
jgi:ABC-2 type transport system ATP-binding protein